MCYTTELLTYQIEIKNQTKLQSQLAFIAHQITQYGTMKRSVSLTPYDICMSKGLG